MANHMEQSTAQLSRADTLRAQLGQEYLKPAEYRDQREVTRLNNKIRAAVKLAEVHALLAIAQLLDDLGRRS